MGRIPICISGQVKLISISRSIKERVKADAELLIQKAFECYEGAIESVQKHAVEVSPGDAEGHRATLGRLRRQLAEDQSCQTLDQISREFDAAIEEYSGKLSGYYNGSNAEVKEITSLLRDATRTLAARSTRYNHEFQGFATKLEKTASKENLREIRMQLSEQVLELRTCVDAMRTDSLAALQPLQAELRAIEGRLERAEKLATIDPLTNVFNRREGERRASEKMRNDVAFCLLVIDLNRFKSINDRYGHHCGDQVLKLFAQKLEQCVRAGDTVCRWGGDEFLTILECPLSDAFQRSKQLAHQLRGKFTVLVNGRKVDIELSASVGVSQYQQGESMETTFERADAMLYQMKQRD